jgi:hypothetical protein
MNSLLWLIEAGVIELNDSGGSAPITGGNVADPNSISTRQSYQYPSSIS